MTARITIAGLGTVGCLVRDTFGRAHECRVYDPPLGLGAESDLDGADFVFVCVPTPTALDGSCDISIVEDVVRRTRVRRAVIVHSTVMVGTTDRLAQIYGAPVVFCPELAGERPDHPFRDPRNRRFFVFGGAEGPAREAVNLFRTAHGPDVVYEVVPARVAEMTKYMENAFLATKVAFCNDFFDLCEAAGVSFEDVRRLWLLDDRVGASHTVVTAERGFAGKCLPKDVAAACAYARRSGVSLEVLEAVLRANVRHRAPRR